MKTWCYIILALMVLNLPIAAGGSKTAPPRIKVETGTLEGISDIQAGVQLYLGIPYAKPPLGPLRWKAPQPAEKWRGVRAAKKFGPSPMQTAIWGDMKLRADSLSEDCLYLNVWRPAQKSNTLLPVLVYFYGGGFVAGDGSERRYDGAAMAQQGIVALTVNYRLNIFGFYAHPELSAESPWKASGNYGLLDQNAALQWVQRNIKAFGGDPKRVTIAGESAGSISVSAQMASPLSRNLIAGAIGESGAAIHPTLAPVSLAEAEKQGLEFARQAGFKSIDKMRALSTKTIFDAYLKSGRFGFPLVIDGYFLPKTLPEIFRAGEQAQVPLLAGWNSAEIPGYAFTEGPYTEEAYLGKLKEAYPQTWEEAARLYPHGSEKEIELSATALASDRFIAYSTWKWLDLHRQHSTQPVYRYLFSKLRPPLAENLTPGLAGGTSPKTDNSPRMPEAVGAPHACEIEYCLGNLRLIDDFAWTPEDYTVSAVMMAYFADFIKTGNPNGSGLVEWPEVRAGDPDPAVMVIDVHSASIPSQLEARYHFLDKSYGN
ncbi:MAG TPA: carboxylesterase family protein [bacterium]|nr:carboxylesterase family protein [bacterium]HQI47970.1 carboxylesterase family protein [bacterium]HQJ65629.1 carboxylesterase family protein [bacterium]